MYGAFIGNYSYTESIPPIEDITMDNLGYHLGRFIWDVIMRKKDGTEFLPECLHHVVCEIQCLLRYHGKPEIDSFKAAPFAIFRMILDAEMKRLQRSGVGCARGKKRS